MIRLRFRAPCCAALLLLAGLSGLAGCSDLSDRERTVVTVIGDQPEPFRIGARSLSPGAAALRAATAQGLVGFDAEGRIVPALAQRWVVTDDGLSYIFRLPETRWNDGSEMEAEELARILRQRLAELRRTRYALDLIAIGEVVAMTGRVIEIRLVSPQPNLLELLAQPELGLVRDGAGSGPMRAVGGGGERRLILRQGESGRDAEDGEATPHPLHLRGAPAAVAIVSFAHGWSDVVLGGRFQHLPLLAESDVDPGSIRLDPAVGLFGLQFVEEEGFIADPANREAISMAIDRPRLLTAFNLLDWQEAEFLVPASLPGKVDIARPGWADQPMDVRRETARARVEAWRAEGGGAPAPLRISLPEGAGSRILFARIAADLAAIGLDARMVGIGEDADLRLLDETAAYSSPLWYLDRLSCDNARVCSREADMLAAQAIALTDLGERARMYAAAETALTAHNGFVPLGVPVRWSLARPDHAGFAINTRGWHPLQYLVVREP